MAKSIQEKLTETYSLKVTGVVGKPEIARNNRSYQMFFVNSEIFH